jgi:O-antigen ligase
MAATRRDTLIGAFATFSLFTVLAGQFWRNLLGYWGWGVIALLVVVGAVVVLVRVRPAFAWRRVPKSTIFFLALAALSIAWSFYPGASALGVTLTLASTLLGVTLVLCVPWPRLARALAAAIKWVLALSLVFEVWVGLFVHEPVAPNFVEWAGEDVPSAFYWSRGLLFSGGPIEGIVGNRNLLAMVALLGVVVFGCLVAAGAMHRGRGIAWIVVAVGILALTRSATVILCAAVVAVALAFALWARRVGPDRRRGVYWAAAGAVAASVALVAVGWNQLLQLFGKSEDLTGRFDIWASVTELASQRPWFGWGWVGYWVPWVEPFDDLAVRKGVTYLQAHNAWLDVWLQLGIVGVLVFAAMVVGALWRSWFLAVDRPMDASGDPLPYSAAALLPLLVLVSLLAQSLAESRILIEGGWVLLIVIAWATKQRQWAPEPLPATTTASGTAR